MTAFADRVKETTTTTGTGTLTLGGAATGYQSFSTAFGNGVSVYYVINGGSDWEIGIGTTGAGTLSRDTVLRSSNAGALVPLAAGTKDVFCSYVADRAVTTSDSATLTNKTISGASNTLSNIGNASLTSSSVTVNGTSISLGGSGTITAANPNALTLGTYLTGGSYTGSAAVTAAVDATNLNTASKVVARDASGNFSAGTITAAISGNATTATTLQTARTINGTSFDGSANITVTAAAGTLTGTTLNATVTGSSLTSVGTIASGTWNGTAVDATHGGTGLTSAPSSGQLAIGNGTGYTLNTLTAGTGVTITNGTGTITIAAAGSTPDDVYASTRSFARSFFR